jgi:hypothetical protein
MIYLASPYSSATPLEREERFLCVAAYAAQLMVERKRVYSPIAHWHTIDRLATEKIAYDHYIDCDLHFLSLCEEMYVLCLPGWEQSTGVKIEIDEANRLGIPIEYIHFGEQL